MKLSVDELDKKINSTLNTSDKVMEETSGSYLDRMESFLSKQDNDTIKQIICDEKDEDYDANIDWNIPKKEACDVGENTVSSTNFIEIP